MRFLREISTRDDLAHCVFMSCDIFVPVSLGIYFVSVTPYKYLKLISNISKKQSKAVIFYEVVAMINVTFE